MFESHVEIWIVWPGPASIFEFKIYWPTIHNLILKICPKFQVPSFVDWQMLFYIAVLSILFFFLDFACGYLAQAVF